MHWACRARTTGLACVTHCFDVDGPEYLTAFERDGKAVAVGRTVDMTETVRAVSTWLSAGHIEVLHTRFPFVDKTKRSLLRICDDLSDALPAFATAVTRELRDHGSDIWDLALSVGDRSCAFSFHGKNEFPDAQLGWDGCPLIKFNANDWPHFVRIFDLWVIKRAMPSAMRSQFPGLTFRRAAEFYERGQGIQGEFVESWDHIEAFFSRAVHTPSQIVDLLREMRGKGFDVNLRAGQSLYSLVLSRSRRHGLRQEQPSLVFHFHRNSTMDVVISEQGGERTLLLPIGMTQPLEEALTRLAALDID